MSDVKVVCERCKGSGQEPQPHVLDEQCRRFDIPSGCGGTGSVDRTLAPGEWDRLIREAVTRMPRCTCGCNDVMVTPEHSMREADLLAALGAEP